MFGRTIQLDVVKKNKKDDGDITIQDTLDAISDEEKAEAVKALLTFVTVNVVKSIVVCTVIRSASRIAENRLSK